MNSSQTFLYVFKKTFKAAYNVARYPNRLTQPLGKFNELDVYYDNDLVCANNVSYAVIMNNHDKSSLVLVVDDNFYALDNDSQRFLMYHEYGHYINKHISPGQKKYKRDIVHEIEADRVGVENTSKEIAIKTLEFMYNYSLSI